MDTIKIATRDSYGKVLVEIGKENDNIVVLDADLAEATKTIMFKKEFPDRHIDCGIAECNMMGIAAGIATTGRKVFASSFAMFAAGRAFEIVRNSIGYTGLNVSICATHAGISVGEDGASHQCCEDIALMRTIPKMTVISPSDDIETKAAVRALLDSKGPSYLRLGRLPVPIINDGNDYKFEVGKGITLREGNDATIVATGLMVFEALKAFDILREKGINIRVINIHTIKPIDKEIIINAAKETKFIITAEEHNIIGGLGSAVCDVLSENYPSKVIKIGVNDMFGMSGSALELLEKFQLTGEHIANRIKSEFSRR